MQVFLCIHITKKSTFIYLKVFETNQTETDKSQHLHFKETAFDKFPEFIQLFA